MIDVTKQLQILAAEAGIDLIGVANLSKLESFGDHLNKYEKTDIAFFHGTIYDKIEYRKVWDKTKSIISFGVSYHQNIPAPKDINSRGIISKCALGEDYHRVLSAKAKELMNKLEKKICVCEYRIFVDTGVLSDRIIAYCAGLGFYGKNNFIINRKFGSFIFLGHILIDAEFKQNQTFEENLCLDCTKCISSCPTGAVNEGKLLDYKKCISYRTQKGTGESTYGYIYGCDVCQNCCPFNIKVPLTVHDEFRADTTDAYPLLEDIMNMGAEEYLKKYGQSSMYWRGYETIRRNCENIMKNRPH